MKVFERNQTQNAHSTGSESGCEEPREEASARPCQIEVLTPRCLLFAPFFGVIKTQNANTNIVRLEFPLSVLTHQG